MTTARPLGRGPAASPLELDAADDLIDAVHALDGGAVQCAFERWCATYDGDDDPTRALVVLLAAAVPRDQPVVELVAWVRDPERYRRLRSTGLAPSDAMSLASRLDRQESPHGHR